MLRANLVAERVAIEAYSQMIRLIGDKDSTTRRVLESILSQEQQHANELSDWLATSPVDDPMPVDGGANHRPPQKNPIQPLEIDTMYLRTTLASAMTALHSAHGLRLFRDAGPGDRRRLRRRRFHHQRSEGQAGGDKDVDAGAITVETLNNTVMLSGFAEELDSRRTGRELRHAD